MDDKRKPPSLPLNDGEIILKLLQRNPQEPSATPQPPTTMNTTMMIQPQPYQVLPEQAFPLDPAVAVVGPTLPLPAFLSPSDYDYRFCPPHSLSQSGPLFVHGVFPQAQNPNLVWSSAPPPIAQQLPLAFGDFHPYQVHLGENLQNLGFSCTNERPQLANQKECSLIFGSLPAGFGNFGGQRSVISPSESSTRMVSPNDNRINSLDSQFDIRVNHNPGVVNSEIKFGNGNVVGMGRLQNAVSYRATPSPFQEVRQPPPAGFISRPKGVNRNNFEDNFDRRRNRAANSNQWVVSSTSKQGLHVQLDRPGLQSGSDFCSASDAKVSMQESQAVIGEESGDASTICKVDELQEKFLDSLGLEDGSDEKVDQRRHRSLRDKDYRSDERGKRLLSQKMRSHRRFMCYRPDINRLNVPFLTIYESLIPADEEKHKQRQVLMLLERLVAKEWPNAKLYVYGSCANTFGFSGCDIDACLVIDDLNIDKSEVILKLAEILESVNLKNVQALTHARVPIVKFMDPGTGISCDVCVNNVLAVVNTKLLRDYSQIDPRLRQLAFIVKHWAKLRGVNETYRGTLSSYAYVLMCIHFLQQRRPAILPCLQAMKATYSASLDSINCSYFDQVESIVGYGSCNHEGLAHLVWGFFNYWAYCHDYANDVISIRTGSIVSKQVKDWTRRIGNDRHLICIEDPFELSHDLGRVVDKYSIKVLREEFERAAEIMQHDPEPCALLFEPYTPNKTV